MAKTLVDRGNGKKMKLQKTTWIVLGLALALGSFVYFNEIKKQQQSATIKNEKRQIFNFKERDIQQLIIETERETLKFERIADNKQSQWQMKQPENFLVNDGVMAFLLNLLVKGNSERAFNVPLDRLNHYGFQPPRATIKIVLNNRKEHQLILGKSDFENKLVYARTDPNGSAKKDTRVLLISKNFHYAVLARSLEDWRQSEDKKNTGS